MLEQISTQINTNTISLSSAAAQAVQNILAEKNLEGYALRIYVAGGGCGEGALGRIGGVELEEDRIGPRSSRPCGPPRPE